MSEPKLVRRFFLVRLVSLFCVCLLAQCTLPEPPPQELPPPQVQEGRQAPTLAPEEQLELFNTFLDRA